MGEFYHLGYPTNKMGDLYLLLLWNVEDGSTGLGMNRQLQTAHWISVWYRYYLWVEHRNLTNGLNRSKIHHESIWFKIQQFNAMRMKMSECLTKGNLENQWCSKWYWVFCPPIKMYSVILDTIELFVSRLGAMLTALICFWACFGWKDLKFYTMFI